jgi:hypothetical protein
MSVKSKLTEDLPPIKLTSPSDFSKKKLELTQLFNKIKWLIFWELLKEKVSKVSSKDLVLNIYKRNLIEVTEKLDVSEHGTHLELDGLFLELVNWVITTEQNKTKKFTESEKELEEDATIMPLLIKI